MKTKCLSCFDILKDEIKDAFGGRLLPAEYSREGTMVKPQRKKLEFLKMKELKGKVIIMCEDYCQNFRDNTDFHQLVNLSPSSNLRKYTNDDIKNIDATKYTQDNRDKFAMIVPDDTHPITQSNSFAAINYGTQFIFMNYGRNDDSLKTHLKYFREKGTQFVLKKKPLRHLVVTTKKPIVVNKAGEGLNKTKKRTDPTTGKTYDF
jgi:hypothetical protein